MVLVVGVALAAVGASVARNPHAVIPATTPARALRNRVGPRCKESLLRLKEQGVWCESVGDRDNLRPPRRLRKASYLKRRPAHGGRPRVTLPPAAHLPSASLRPHRRERRRRRRLTGQPPPSSSASRRQRSSLASSPHLARGASGGVGARREG